MPGCRSRGAGKARSRAQGLRPALRATGPGLGPAPGERARRAASSAQPAHGPGSPRPRAPAAAVQEGPADLMVRPGTGCRGGRGLSALRQQLSALGQAAPQGLGRLLAHSRCTADPGPAPPPTPPPARREAVRLQAPPLRLQVGLRRGWMEKALTGLCPLRCRSCSRQGLKKGRPPRLRPILKRRW